MPQVLKDSIRDTILKCATDKFNEVGYLHTKMSDIAKEANMSVGNIYRYYSNKESLYESIVEAIIIEIYNIFDFMDKNRTIDSTNIAAAKFADIYMKNKDVFVLILKNSDHIKTKRTTDEVIEKFYRNVLIFPAVKEKIKTKSNFKIFIHAFASALINGIITILFEEESDCQKIEEIDTFLSFMRNGIIYECNKRDVI